MLPTHAARHPGWRRAAPRLPRPDRSRLQALALAPLGAGLSLSFRRVLRRRPELADRLDAARGATICIQPSELPFAFLIRLDAAQGAVRAVPREAMEAADVMVEAPLRVLLTIFEGRDDGDAAFFSSELTIEGEMAPLVSLRNAIEAAELDWTDILPLPLPPGMAALLGRMAETAGGRR